MRDFDECKPFVEHMFFEHRHLARQLLQVQTLFQSSEPSDLLEKLIVAVLDLKQEISRHFREEEGGGCLDEAIAYCPRLAAEANAIEKEHAGLSEQLERIVEKLQRNPGVKERNEAASEFHSYVQHVLKHETRENKVMAEAFGTTWAENGESYDKNPLPKPKTVEERQYDVQTQHGSCDTDFEGCS